MYDAKIVKIIVPAALAILGGGFVWGISDHRSEGAITNFANSHITLSERERGVWLDFSCDDSTNLVTYDLLNDRVLDNKKEIDKRTGDSSNKVLNSPLFSHTTALAAEGSGVWFSLNDELKLLKTSRSPKQKLGAAIGIAIIPVGYLGYLASGWFKLECSSQVIYDRLDKPDSWKTFRAKAAQNLFERAYHCIDRRITLNAPMQDPDDKGPVGTAIENRDVVPRLEDRTRAITEWRAYVSEINKVPEQSVIASRYVLVKAKDEGEPTWGDSLYQRIYGIDGFVFSDSDFDKLDFQALYLTGRQCAQLDTNVAKDLYIKTGGKNIEKRGR